MSALRISYAGHFCVIQQQGEQTNGGKVVSRIGPQVWLLGYIPRLPMYSTVICPYLQVAASLLIPSPSLFS